MNMVIAESDFYQRALIGHQTQNPGDNGATWKSIGYGANQQSLQFQCFGCGGITCAGALNYVTYCIHLLNHNSGEIMTSQKTGLTTVNPLC